MIRSLFDLILSSQFFLFYLTIFENDNIGLSNSYQTLMVSLFYSVHIHKRVSMDDCMCRQLMMMMLNRKNRFKEKKMKKISQLKCSKNKYKLVLTALVYLAERRRSKTHRHLNMDVRTYSRVYVKEQ